VAAARTLLALGQRRLGAQLGVTAVLHTWTRALHFHPHIHCLVTGGGLAPSAARWVPTPRRYLFPVKALSRLFRGKFLAAVKRAYTQGRFDLGGNCAALTDRNRFRRLLDQLYRKEWVVYAKRPFGGADQVFRYLGRYTHRVAISNRRLLRIDDTGICFATKHGHTVTVGPQEFIRRFLLHVLPTGFVKIRHYGLMAAGNATTKLVVARRLLGGEPPAPATAPGRDAQRDADGTPVTDGRDQLPELGAVDAALCPRCQHGRLIRYALADFVRSHGSAPSTAWDSS